MRADSTWIRPKIERMNTEQLVEELFPKRKVGDIATHEDELAALDSSPITPCCGSYHRRGEINASDLSLVCLCQCECESASSTKADFEHAICGPEMEQVNTPIRLGCMLPTHAFTDKLTDKTGWIAMLLIHIG